jgi:hypothetical protein
VGDVDRDGKLDVVAAAPASSEIAVFVGKGDGTFTAGTPIADANAPTSVALADMNADGALDVVVAEGSGTNETVYLGSGAAPIAFGAGTSAASGLASGVVAVATGDFDGTGTTGFVVGIDSGADVAPIKNSGGASPTYSAYALLAASAAPTSSASVVLGNFHKNGKLDVVAASDAGAPDLFAGNNDGTFAAAATVGTGLKVVSLAVGDFDRDGCLDLVGCDNASASSIVVFLNSKATPGTFTTAAATSTGAAYSSGIAVGDVDGDGISDVVTANADGTVSILIGKGDGTFKAAATTPGVKNASAIALAGLRNNGKLDVVVAGSHGGVVLLGN